MKPIFFIIILFCMACGTKELSMPPEIQLTPPETGSSTAPSSSTAESSSGISSSPAPAGSVSEEGGSSSATDTPQNVVPNASDEPVFLGIHFTEVVTDPQQDWNDSSGGDGIPFDDISGNGTVGSTDEWIEIENDGEATMNMYGYTLKMVDGTDETEFFSAPKGTFVFSDGGSVTDFGAGEVLVIGNPPGDLKNTVTLTLLDETGLPIDEVAVENGDAHGISDESFQLSSDGEWLMGTAGIGF